MKTTTFNVCTWILLASLVLSVSARAKSAHKCAEAVDSNSGNGVPGQHRMSKAGSIAENWEVVRELRDGTPDSYIKQLYSRVEGSKTIKDINSKTKLKTVSDDFQIALPSFPVPPAYSVDEINISNNRAFGKQRSIYENRKVKRDFSLAAALRNKGIVEGYPWIDQEPKLDPDLRKNFYGTVLTQADINKAKQLFKYNNKHEVIVHSDGSACKYNLTYNKKTAGAGVWFGYDNPMNLAMKVPGRQTNNNAEVFAAIRAIERVKQAGLNRVYIQIDSFYLRKVLKWKDTWIDHGWRTSARKKVLNKEMIQKLDDIMKTMISVNWNYTTYAAARKGNREAEKLALKMAKCNT